MTAASLLAELAASGGTVTVPDPPDAMRAAYRRVISRAITEGLVPAGWGLRHTGHDRGDLVIRLVSVDEAARPVTPDRIPVLEDLNGSERELDAFRERPDLLDVSDQSRLRALLIVQAISAECARREYRFGERDDGQPSFQIAVGEDRFLFTLSEEFDRREVIDSEKLATAKYPWQRIPSTVQPVRSGRLLLRMGSGYGSRSWADRTRWTLDQKLPQMFAEVAGRASAEAENRRLREERRRGRREEWETALTLARQAYIDHVNRNRLNDQAARSAEAEAIRAYCVRLEQFAQSCNDAEVAERVSGWIRWARQQAGQADPLASPEQLSYFTPTKVGPAEIDKFMPKGLTAWTPPD